MVLWIVDESVRTMPKVQRKGAAFQDFLLIQVFDMDVNKGPS